MYAKTTRAIRISVTPSFVEERSAPDENRYIWAYTIIIENQGREVVQLKTRYWRITDAQGHVQEVRGAGVVGEQPILKPGERFQYTSGAPLATPSGFMAGSYQMVTGSGELFNVEIPAFSLDSPHAARILH